ncbi:L-serine ammonia-lyase, iron-sulfur-dependent subunit beta [Bengtsoniella intestinalis]|uniref:L-serine ammonia-lyase, iron-sulfur-dependent subunit beta n=1 Tax=Bengtsoniella intestinalis TaxID=3073143 RepID=UPI00391F2429
MVNAFDIVGPVMIGPSSSHTAGAVRIGLYARTILGQSPIAATIHFSGSFAKTYRGHGTDIAIIAGVLGMNTDDERIPDSFTIAQAQGLAFTFKTVDIENAHPNTVELFLEGDDGATLQLMGSSVGGGNILLNEINHTPVSIDGTSDTLIIPHKDTPGMVAVVSNLLGVCGMNINNISLHREEKGGTAVMTIAIDGHFDATVERIILKQEDIFGVSYLKALA